MLAAAPDAASGRAHVAAFIVPRLLLAFPLAWGLQLCIELLQQPFNAREALVAFNRKMQGLAVQPVVTGVEKGDHGRRLAEVAPGGLNQLALPARLVGRRHGGIAAFAKGDGLSTASAGRVLVDPLGLAHVTDPGVAGLAPSASRTKWICSA